MLLLTAGKDKEGKEKNTFNVSCVPLALCETTVHSILANTKAADWKKPQMEIQPFDHQLKVRVVPQAGWVLIDSATKDQLYNILIGENKENLIKSISYGLSFTQRNVTHATKKSQALSGVTLSLQRHWNRALSIPISTLARVLQCGCSCRGLLSIKLSGESKIEMNVLVAIWENNILIGYSYTVHDLMMGNSIFTLLHC